VLINHPCDPCEQTQRSAEDEADEAINIDFSTSTPLERNPTRVAKMTLQDRKNAQSAGG
jgi:hypothetical protein